MELLTISADVMLQRAAEEDEEGHVLCDVVKWGGFMLTFPFVPFKA